MPGAKKITIIDSEADADGEKTPKKGVVKRSVRNSVRNSENGEISRPVGRGRRQTVKKKTTRAPRNQKAAAAEIEPALADLASSALDLTLEKSLDAAKTESAGKEQVIIPEQPKKISIQEGLADQESARQPLLPSSSTPPAPAALAADDFLNPVSGQPENQELKIHAVGFYRKIVLSLMTATVLLAMAVAYIFFVRAEIILVPNQERVSNNLIFDIVDQSKSEIPAGALKGAVEEMEISFTAIYPATGREVLGQETIGEVILHNNYNKNQPLVATTRLESPDGKLFRLKETVNLPAGASISAAVYADQPGEEMAIGPTTFVLPGLWAGLQDKIYAESKNSFIFQKKEKKFILQNDIDAGLRDIKQKLNNQIEQEIKEKFADFSQFVFKIDENTLDYDVQGEAKEEKEEFTISASVKAVAGAFNKEEVAVLAKNRLLDSIGATKELINFDDQGISYVLQAVDLGEKAITVNAAFTGKVIIKTADDMINLNSLTNQSDERARQYLSGLDGLAGFEIKYSPAFFKRMPLLSDKIKLQLKK